MATDVNQLAFGLDRIAKLASSAHSGASDRRRTLVSISNICVRAMQGTLDEVYDIPKLEESNVNDG